jgi:hypothetical protein
LIPLYVSMIGEIIVWSSFCGAHRETEIMWFLTGEDSILFEVTLHPGDVAACIEDCSRFGYESELLIAASSGFTVDSIEFISIESISDMEKMTLSKMLIIETN